MYEIGFQRFERKGRYPDISIYYKTGHKTHDISIGTTRTY